MNYEEAQAEKMRAKAAKLAKKENPSGSKKARGQKRKGEVEEGEETKAKREKKAPVAKFKIPANLLKAMDSDKVNKRLWGEIQSKEFKTRKELVDFAEELLQCQFCMSIVTHPVTTHCSHSFCKSCLQRGFQSQYYKTVILTYDSPMKHVIIEKIVDLAPYFKAPWALVGGPTSSSSSSPATRTRAAG